MSRSTRVLLLGLAAGTLIAAFLFLRSDGDSASSANNPALEAGKGADHDGHAGGHAPSGASDGEAATGAAGSPTPTGDPSAVIRTEDSQPVGGVTVLRVTAGDQIRFDVDADTEDEVHVHGYDVSAAAKPGTPAKLAFTADIEGVFEVELEKAGVEIARVMVEPR